MQNNFQQVGDVSVSYFGSIMIVLSSQKACEWYTIIITSLCKYATIRSEEYYDFRSSYWAMIPYHDIKSM